MTRDKKKKKKKADPSELITVPVDKLILVHGEIGIHRGRKYGFRTVFGFRTLVDVPFTRLAKKVKAAYDGTSVPDHKGWAKQREMLQWFVDRGVDALYQLDDDIHVYKQSNGVFALAEGNHRALALYILGADSVRALIVKREARHFWNRPGFGSLAFRTYK